MPNRSAGTKRSSSFFFALIADVGESSVTASTSSTRSESLSRLRFAGFSFALGRNSRQTQVGRALDFEELVVYAEDAALPTHLVVYSLD